MFWGGGGGPEGAEGGHEPFQPVGAAAARKYCWYCCGFIHVIMAVIRWRSA